MKIKEDVLAVLSLAIVDGRSVTLSGQLDPKLYKRTNEVLEALGGKWNRKAKAHLFDTDAGEAIETAILTGEVSTNRDIGFFPTPPSLAERLCAIAQVARGSRCLEPSAGSGNIVRALVAAGGDVIAVERDEKMRGKLGDSCTVLPYDDFLLVPSGATGVIVDRVVMNPPFIKSGLGNHLDHVEHAYRMLAPSGVLVSVLPSSIVHRSDKRHRDFREWFVGLGGDVMNLPSGSFKTSGTMVETVALRLARV